MKKIIIVILLYCAGNTVFAQVFCERRIAGPEFYSVSKLISIDTKIFYVFSESTIGFENPKVFLVKADYCLNPIDSVRISIDSTLFRSMYPLVRIKDEIFGITRETNFLPVPFDTNYRNFRTQLLVFDTNLVLVRSINLRKHIGRYNYIINMHVLEDTLLLIKSSNRTGVPSTQFCLLDTQGNLLDNRVEPNSYLYTSAVGRFDGVDKNFFTYGRYNYNFKLRPFRLTSVDTILNLQQSIQYDIGTVKKIVTNSSGDVYYSDDDHISAGLGNEIVILKFDRMGILKEKAKYGGRLNDGMGEDAFTLTENEDLVLASYSERLVSQAERVSDLVVSRFDPDLNLKWRKTVDIPGSSFFSISVVGTPDNGATILSVTLDTNQVNTFIGYNDLHILHIDSTGYYSPLSTDDFEDMWSSSISVFPNPVSIDFSISGLEENEEYQAGVYAVEGNLVKRLSVSYPFEVELSGIKAGSYLLILQDNEGKRVTRRFVKQ